MVRGSYIAVLKDGQHRASSGAFPSPAEFHRIVSDDLEHVRYMVVKFCYAVGGEMQVYNGGEVREVYFGPEWLARSGG